MNTFFEQKFNYIFLIFFIAVVIALYFPVFNTEYLYTDEANQLWLFKKDINFETSVPQGRYLTYKIFEWVFNDINTVNKVIYARLFSFIGWLVSLPIWFLIITRVALKNNIPKALVLLLMIYIITMPPFIIYIGWSACMEMFIGCTSALVGGFLLYEGIINNEKKIKIKPLGLVLSIVLGLIALFTYQNCYGCFLIPFAFHFIREKKLTKTLFIGFAVTVLTFVIYYLIFKYSLHIYALPGSNRGSFATDPINKLIFLITRPLASAFHFTYIFNEKSIIGFIFYGLCLFIWLAINLLSKNNNSFLGKLVYLFGIFTFLVLIYLPSLIVKENYSSNRTLFALDLFIFILFFETIFSFLKKDSSKYFFAGITGFLFLLNAWYNFNFQFINPIKVEYSLLKKIIADRYKTGISTINFICPSDDAFKTTYGITSSWDEFGIPSTAKLWVPESLIKQLILEKTGKRQVAESVLVKTWISKEAFQQSGTILSNDCVLIDMQKELWQ